VSTARPAPRRRRLDLALPRLTARGWVVLAAAAVAVIVAISVGWRDLLYVGLVLGALVLASAIAVRSRAASLVAERRNSPDVVPSGGRLAVQLTVSNTAWLRTPAQWWRDLTPRGMPSPEFQALPSLAGRGFPGSSIRLGHQLTAGERGVAWIGPMVVEHGDAFGLVLHERLVGEPAPLTVLPRIVPLGGAVAGRTSIADASVPAWKTGHGHDDVVPREYRAGDALRHVNWRATAHRGELMVRQAQSQDESRALLVLDTRRESYPSLDAFEWAVSFTASLLVHLSDSGVGVSLLETAPSGTGMADVDRTPREALLSLATVDRRAGRSIAAGYLDRLGDALTAAPAPVYAVLGAVPDQELRELAGHKSRASTAALVLVGDRGRSVPDEVWFAGWRCVSVSATEDMADAWRQASAAGRAA
jgi:uncharacterized protein (DUF58 family)